MSKKGKKIEEKLGDAGTEAVAEAPAAEGSAKSRGPRGVTETAVISLKVTGNPKRPGSKAFGAFANYRDGMTVKEFADAVGKEATGHLVYDAKHGFISIEGYDPGAIVVPKPRAAKKEKPAKPEGQPAPEVAAEVESETMA